MASTSIQKMSLAAEFDDLCRYTNVLTAGSEGEFKAFIVGVKKLINKYKEAEKKMRALETKIAKLEAGEKKFEVQLKHMKNLVEEEVLKRKKYEKENICMEKQISLIKEALLANRNTIDSQTIEKLVSLSTRTSSIQQEDTQAKLEAEREQFEDFRRERSSVFLSDSDLDETEDDSYKKLRNSNIEQHLKEVEFNSDVETFTEKSEITIRSNSEPSMICPDLPMPLVLHRSDSEQIKYSTYNPRTSKLLEGTSIGRYSTGGKLSRRHAFVLKTVIRTEKCYPCGKVVKFCKQALKCSDCRITCHPECKDQCPLPCIPTTYTPTKGIMGTIAAYTSTTPPMIPSLIVHCVNEIESRGLKEVGLYRKSGSEREVKDLKNKLLKNKNINTLNQADIHAVCGTIKDFLRSLKDSLITRAAWQVFVESSEHEDEARRLNLIFDAVCLLPQSNKETLAFLILHLQRVAESPNCKMPLENLAKIFGPTIVGYSSVEDFDMLAETRQQCQVMQYLLMMPSDLWKNILDMDFPEVFQNSPALTTECLPPPKASRLGPVYSADQKRNHVGRTPLAPRNLRNTIKTGKNRLTEVMSFS